MGSQIVCPHCGKILASNLIIDEATTGAGSSSRSVICECGEKITYWQITAQLREQNSFSKRFKNWFRDLTHSHKQV